LDLRARDEIAGELVDEAGDEYQVGSFGDRAEVGRRDRAPVELSFTRAQGGHADGAVAHLNETEIETVLPEEALVLSDVNDGFPLAQRSHRHDDFHRRRRGSNGLEHPKREKQKQRFSRSTSHFPTRMKDDSGR
jgi:hypothetical protein